MIINNNIPAMNTYHQMGVNQQAGQNAMEKLASGLRINKAGGDAAGLAISEKMRGQIRGLDQASRNAQDGISIIETAEGALNETHSILQRMRELAVQASNDTNVGVDRDELQRDFKELSNEINRIKNETEFNKQTILDGSGAGTDGKVQIQTGASSDQLTESDFTTSGVDLTSVHTAVDALDISTNQDAATKAIDLINSEIETVSAGRSYLGAMQNRLEHTINNLNNSA
jgi:flagellin